MAYLNKLTGSYPLTTEEVRSIWVDRRMDSDGVTNQNKRYIYEALLTSQFTADSDFAWVFPVPSGVDSKKETVREVTPRLGSDGNYHQQWDYDPLGTEETKTNFDAHISDLIDEINVSVTDTDAEVITFASDDDSRDFLSGVLLILDSDNATTEVVLEDTTTKTVKKSVISSAIQAMVTETATIRIRERFYDPNTNGFLCIEDSSLGNVATRSSVTLTNNSVTWDDSSQSMTFTTAGNNFTTSDVESLMDSDFTLFIEYKPQSNDNRTIFHLASDTSGSPSYSQPLVNVIDGQVYAGVNGTTASITSDSDAISADSSDTFCIGLSFEKYTQQLELTVDGVRHGTAYGASPAISGTTLLLVGGANDNTTSNFGWSATDNDLQGHVLKVKAWDKALSPSDLKRVKTTAGY